jgi:ornithine cyclodeaminase
MIYVTEAESAALASHELAYSAVREALIAAFDPSAASFPVVVGPIPTKGARFTVKSASVDGLTGLKVGSYFPTNDAVGLPRHNSMILLFDLEHGRIGAIVEGGKLNAYRTAAADAVAVDALARQDARVLALYGAGHQAKYEAEAVARVRTLDKVLVVGRSPQKVAAFVSELREAGLPAEASGAEAAVRAADIIVTVTPSGAPLFEVDWVKPGTHVSSMGSDGPGKQELPPELLAGARLAADLPEQSRRVGEFQHAPTSADIAAIGAVLTGAAPGRIGPDEITVFDSSGIALQDLYMAKAVIAAYQASNA